jgi:hypothetical protein
MGRKRVFIGLLAAGLLSGSLLTGTSSAEVTSLLPSLTPALLLDIANQEAPPAGTGLQVHADFPTEHPLVLDGVSIYSLTADITPDGQLLTRSVLTGAEFAGGADKVGECDDPTFLPTGVKWSAEKMPILWRFDRRSVPSYIKADKTIETVRFSHRVWPQAQSNCADPSHYSFGYNYLGHTAKNPKYDGANIVDFGDLGQGALAVNSTWYTSSNEIVEVDLRLNKADYKWSNIEGVHLYQVGNVVAHELGHQVGLDDLGAPHQAQTMFGQIGKGELNKVTLGRGDLRGASTIAP